jgi:prophage regulatory protein
MKIIRRTILADKLGVSLPTLWRMEKAGNLPPKIRIGLRAVGWRESDIEAFIQSREEQHKLQEMTYG